MEKTPAQANSKSDPTASQNEGTPKNTASDSKPVEESIEALQAALDSVRVRLQQRLSEEVEQHRNEVERLKSQVVQLRSEADAIMAQANENAARIIAEARQKEAQTLEQTQHQVDSLLARLRERAGTFLDRAATEINAVQEAIAAARSTGAPSGEASAVERPASGLGGDESEEEHDEERVVTRLIVRPGVAVETRTRFKERLERLPGVYAVLFGAAEDESFEMLLAHDRSATLPENIVALAPDGLAVKDERDGVLEIELTDPKWLQAPVSAGS